MPRELCNHEWKMINLQSGFIVTEKCINTNEYVDYFSTEDAPSMQEYKDGDKYWIILGADQTIRFELECQLCGQIINYDNLLGLMNCTGCTGECHLNNLTQVARDNKILVYAALCYQNKPNVTEYLTLDQLKALNKLYNSRLASRDKKILIVSSSLRLLPKGCRGDIFKDVGLLSEEEPE
ncbi:MAG: hypothetical protein JXA60_06305 [Candidatus Coatesbacteria bacterium]|nr:hypothetical protein [Candidatus Coatesbacteria bacterium]